MDLSQEEIAKLKTELESIKRDDPEAQLPEPDDNGLVESRTFFFGTNRAGDPTWELIETRKVWHDPFLGFEDSEVTDPDAVTDSDTEPVAKGLSYDGGDSDVLAQMGGGNTSVIAPRYNPSFLYELVRTSAHLRAPIDAYVANIETDHVFDPVLDFSEENRDELREQIRGAMLYEQALGLVDDDPTTEGGSGIITDEMVDSKILSLQADAMLESFRIRHIFASFTPGSTFLETRKRTREDMESTGSGYWEILRENRIPRYGCYVRAPFIREVTPSREPAPWTIYERVPGTPIVRRVERTKIYRRFVERVGGKTVYYKEFGDPRPMDARTGRYYPIPTQDQIDAGISTLPATAKPATELYQWTIHDATSPAGCPRWTGTILGIQGSMATDRVNLDYFQAKPPAGILLVTGTRLGRRALGAIERRWSGQVRGEERFHGLAVIEAMSPPNLPSQASGKIGIEFIPLTQTQTGDALFQRYDTANGEKVGAIMRVPPILRGRVEDTNRANGESSERIAESQVFSKERQKFDDTINNVFLPSMGITLWTFRSLAPDPIDYDKAKIIALVSEKTQILSLNEQRRELAAALNISLLDTDRELGVDE